MKANKILFIGGFRKSKKGYFGGVYSVCNSMKTELEDFGYKIIPLDITLNDIAEINAFKRMHSLVWRQIKFIYLIALNRDAKYLYVMFGAGSSYLDKIFIIYFANVLGIKIISFPSSGFILNDLSNKFYKIIVSNIFNISFHVICQSDYWKDMFSSFVDKKKLTIIENWATQSVISRSMRLGFPSFNIYNNDILKIVYFSRVEKEKGVFDLIDLIPYLIQKIPFEIDIYGSGSSFIDVRNKIYDLNYQNIINLKGWLPHEECLEEINRHHVAVFPSRYESYPGSLLEFIFSKIPIVASNISSVQAIGLEYVHYYQPGNICQLAEQINNLYTNYNHALFNAKTLLNISLIRNDIKYAIDKLNQIMV
ncbi:MAG: glycosyltransferase family 4 protein [Chlorobiaceae bacterium]